MKPNFYNKIFYFKLKTKMRQKINLRNLKLYIIPFFLFPLIFVLIGKLLVLKNFLPLVENYEEERMKIIQSFLYFLGLGIFFFCNAFSDFISKKIFPNRKDIKEKIYSFSFYTFIMLSFLNLISICGFIGFLICGNFTWLATFSIINFLSLFSYFPTEKRFTQKIEKFTSE